MYCLNDFTCKIWGWKGTYLPGSLKFWKFSRIRSWGLSILLSLPWCLTLAHILRVHMMCCDGYSMVLAFTIVEQSPLNKMDATIHIKSAVLSCKCESQSIGPMDYWHSLIEWWEGHWVLTWVTSDSSQAFECNSGLSVCSLWSLGERLEYTVWGGLGKGRSI